MSARTPRSARLVAALAVLPFAERFPDANATELNPQGLTPADAAFARRIHRVTLQRWLTLQLLVEHAAQRPLAKLEPKLVAALMTGSAQAALMPDVPGYAAVNATVELTKTWVRPKAAGITNAVLRKVLSLLAEHTNTPWHPARDALPITQPLSRASGGGGPRCGSEGALAQGDAPAANTNPFATLRLTQPLLPPTRDRARHLAAATSVPQSLVERWTQAIGPERTTALCLHAMQAPPVIVTGPDADNTGDHDTPGFAVFDAKRADLPLTDWLAADPTRRVQDPAATRAVAATADLNPQRILDACAGRGTKTRQLRALHPAAHIHAHDPDDDRRADLRRLAKRDEHTTVIDHPQGPYDLIVLDVPCTNTGVLARRPEARYRFGERSLRSVLDLQRGIIDAALPHAAPGAHILYTTCSLEPEENTNQAHALARRTNATIITEHQALPAGHATTYHDGSYHALLQLPNT